MEQLSDIERVPFMMTYWSEIIKHVRAVLYFWSTCGKSGETVSQFDGLLCMPDILQQQYSSAANYSHCLMKGLISSVFQLCENNINQPSVQTTHTSPRCVSVVLWCSLYKQCVCSGWEKKKKTDTSEEWAEHLRALWKSSGAERNSVNVVLWSRC